MSLASSIALVAVAFQSTAKAFSGTAKPKGLTLTAMTRGLIHSMRNRRDFNRIAEMDHSLLRDIGLTAGDVYLARNLPLSEDPTQALARMVDERRRPSSARSKQ